MASKALQAIRRTVTVEWPKSAEADARKFLVRMAREGHAKIMAEQTARGGFPPEWDAYANRPGQTNLDNVILPGPIVFRYRYMRELISFALEELRKASPVISGEYRDSHTLYINGVPATTIPDRIESGMELFISNPVPYARRLEVGLKEDGRPFVVQVPPRIYERVMKNTLRPRFRNVAKLSLDYVTIPGAWVIKGRLPSHYIAKGGVRRRRRQEVGKPVRAPAIVISVL
jgi:hypothetical protein